MILVVIFITYIHASHQRINNKGAVKNAQANGRLDRPLLKFGFRLANRSKKGQFRLAKRASTIQYGYRECGTRARVFSQTLPHWKNTRA